MAHDPYLSERTADPAVNCGGDYGHAICGGMGYLLGWLPFASAFRNAEELRFHDGTDHALDTLHARPVIDLR